MVAWFLFLQQNLFPNKEIALNCVKNPQICQLNIWVREKDGGNSRIRGLFNCTEEEEETAQKRRRKLHRRGGGNCTEEEEEHTPKDTLKSGEQRA